MVLEPGWMSLGRSVSKVVLYADLNDDGGEGSCRAGKRRRESAG
jgi:hypothetical protein